MRDLWCTSFSKVQVTILACQQTSCEGKSCKLLRAFVSENIILSCFIISKNYFINYTIPFYNTSNIPTFIFPILLIKIIYLPNKIIYPKTQIKKKNPKPKSSLQPPATTTTTTTTNKYIPKLIFISKTQYPNLFLSVENQSHYQARKKKKKNQNHGNPQNQNKKQTTPRQPPTPATTAMHKIKPNPPLLLHYVWLEGL